MCVVIAKLSRRWFTKISRNARRRAQVEERERTKISSSGAAVAAQNGKKKKKKPLCTMNRIGACACKQLPMARERMKNERKKLLKNKTQQQPQQSECSMRTIYIFKMFENRKNALQAHAYSDGANDQLDWVYRRGMCVCVSVGALDT